MIHSAQEAQMSLERLKNDVIGLVKYQGNFDLIVYKWDDIEAVDTITVTQFGAINENFRFPVKYGEVKYFPKGRNMNEMLDYPFEWDEFIKSFS